MRDVDLGEPTSFLDHAYLGCTERECKISSDIVANYRDMVESRNLMEPRKNCLSELQENLMRKQYLLGPMTWKVMQRKKYVERSMHGWPSIYGRRK